MTSLRLRISPAITTWETPRQRPQVSGIVSRARAFLSRHPEDPVSASASVQQAALRFRHELFIAAKQVLLYVSAHGGVAAELLELRAVLNEFAPWFPGEDFALESVFSKAASVSLKSNSSSNSVSLTGYFAQRFRKVCVHDRSKPPFFIMDALHLRFTLPEPGECDRSLDCGWVAPTFSLASHQDRLSSPNEAPRNLALSHAWSFYEAHANAVLHGTEAFGPLSDPHAGGITLVTLSGRVKEGQVTPDPEMLRRDQGRRNYYLRFSEPDRLRQSIVTHRELLLDWIRGELLEPDSLPAVMRGGRPPRNRH